MSAAHGRTVAPYHFSFRVAPSFKAPFDGTDPTDTFFQCFLGMTVRFIHGLCGLTEIMEVTELVGHCGEHCRDSPADGELAIRHDTDNRHLHALPYRLKQHGQVCLGRGQQTAGEEDFPGEAIPEDPEHLMAHAIPATLDNGYYSEAAAQALEDLGFDPYITNGVSF